MQNVKTTVPEMVREYQIGNTCYMVKSRSKEQAREDAVTKVKRLIRNDIKKRI
ncbi:transposon-encoded TnpW family protein [Clostridioides difficile]|nr:transposon-encoded TnpW family protein [Clostridioides difficile]